MRGIAVSSASRLYVVWSRMAQLRMLGIAAMLFDFMAFTFSAKIADSIRRARSQYWEQLPLYIPSSRFRVSRYKTCCDSFGVKSIVSFFILFVCR
jgi:hypothetical protein